MDRALFIVTDWSLGEARLFEQLASALSAGVPLFIQHRNPSVCARDFFAQGQRLRPLCQRFDAPLFINGRLDMALALGAHLHLPARGLRPEDVRPHLPPGQLVSAAVHDAAELADAAGADLLLVSPVFPPGSKPADTRAPLTPAGFFTLAGRASVPAYALGGLSPASVAALLAQAPASLRGRFGVACVSGVLGAPSPAEAVLALSRALSTPT